MFIYNRNNCFASENAMFQKKNKNDLLIWPVFKKSSVKQIYEKGCTEKFNKIKISIMHQIYTKWLKKRTYAKTF